jgi:hypothetical protein
MFKFYNNLTFEDSIDHALTGWSPDNIYSFRQWYTEDIQEKDTLLVTVGDSWTWGDHLGSIDWDKNNDDPVRLQQIFGRKLADKLLADWVNLARPGCSNYWMLEQLEDVEQHFHRVKDQYKKIIVVVTLTEDLREANYTRRINVEDPYREMWNKSNSIVDFLKSVESYLFGNLEMYFNRLPFVQAHVSRAFTDSWNTSPLLLDKTWCDVMQDLFKFNNYQRPVPFIGQLSTGALNNKYITTDAQKIEFLNIMSVVETRWQFLGASTYNLKGSTCHPNPAGHQLWADYLFSKIQ